MHIYILETTWYFSFIVMLFFRRPAISEGSASFAAAVSTAPTTFAASTSSVTDVSMGKLDWPCQPKIKFPTDKLKRKFNSGYYERFNWLEYSVHRNEAFCYNCRHFSLNNDRRGEIMGERVFIDVGFSNWKAGIESFKKHEKSKRHENATVFLVNFRSIQAEKTASISEVIESVTDSEIEENREHVKFLLRATMFLGKQNLPFRGHDEKSESANKGNFLELVELISSSAPPAIKSKLNKRYGSYTSH
jgi:hypothetical protein